MNTWRPTTTNKLPMTTRKVWLPLIPSGLIMPSSFQAELKLIDNSWVPTLSRMLIIRLLPLWLLLYWTYPLKQSPMVTKPMKPEGSKLKLVEISYCSRKKSERRHWNSIMTYLLHIDMCLLVVVILTAQPCPRNSYWIPPTLAKSSWPTSLLNRRTSLSYIRSHKVHSHFRWQSIWRVFLRVWQAIPPPS